MDFKYICRWGDHERKGLLLRCGLAVVTPQPPRRDTDILVLADNSPNGPMSTAGIYIYILVMSRVASHTRRLGTRLYFFCDSSLSESDGSLTLLFRVDSSRLVGPAWVIKKKIYKKNFFFV